MAVLTLASGPAAAVAVCDDVADAGMQLEQAAELLYRCAARHDYASDCSRESQEALDAASEYADAVEEANSILDGDADSVCRVPVHIGPAGSVHSL